MILEILIPVGRLFLATIVGYALFKIEAIRRFLLKPIVFLFVNVVFPMYFVDSLPRQWADGIEAGWYWMAAFFVAYMVFLGIQYGIAKLLINRTRLLKSNHPEELLVLFCMHNAGYIPIPIVAAIAPPAVSVYMSFYVMAFVLSFFTLAVWIIQGAAEVRVARRPPIGDDAQRDADAGPHGGETATRGTETGNAAAPEPAVGPKFKLNAPVIGILAGLILAATGWYARFPGWVQAPFEWASAIALDGIMVVLGAVLASIPGMTYHREFGGLILFKMILYPLAVVGVMALLPLRGLSAEVASGVKLAMVLQAAVPPATNILVITQAFGTEEQVEYAGSAIITSYAAGLVLLPVFLIAARLVF